MDRPRPTPTKSAITATKPRRFDSAPTRSIAPARSARPRPSDGAGEAIFGEDRLDLRTPAPRRDRVQVGPGDEDRAEAVLVACRQEADRRGGGQRDLRLLVVLGAEPHGRRRVDDEPRLEIAVGDQFADVRVLGAGGDVPVDPAHVVAGLVEPGLARARSRAPASGPGGCRAAPRRAGG